MTRPVDAQPERGLSPLDRFFRLFGEVRPGESVTILLMVVNIFLLLVCYYVIKTIREPLILLEGGAVGKSYSSAGQALIMMGFIPLYGWVASRVDRYRLVIGLSLFFLINIELFSLAVASQMPRVGIVFFIWVGFFSLTVIAQFWSFANDIFTKDEGKRFFPIIGIGMTAGAPVGALIAGKLFELGIAPSGILHISAALLLLSLITYLLIKPRVEIKQESAPSSQVLPKGNGFALVFKSRYISLIALLFILLNVVNTNGEFVLGELATRMADGIAASDASADRGAVIGAFYGRFFFWVNIAAVVLQTFVVSRIVKYGGLRWALLIPPFISLGAYGFIAAGAGFAVVRWAKTAENSTDYSIMNTARQMLWLPTTRVEKYKAKQAVDTFFVRLGDVLSAGVVFVGTTQLHLSVSGFALGNILFVLIWLAVALLILREHSKLQAGELGDHVS